MTYAHQDSITDLIVGTICSGRSVKRFNQIIYERRLKRYREESFRVTLSRLHKKEYVNHSALGWSMNKKGRLYFSNARLLDYLPSPFEKKVPDGIVVAFDIPEGSRKVRNWLRNQLKIFGYKMMQQSLWIGPGPLPASFLKRLEDLNIRKNVKVFNIKRSS